MREKIGQIKSIWRYPVKSMAGGQLTEALLTKKGLKGDRHWVLWDEIDNELIGGKRFKNIMQLSAVYSQPNDVKTDPSVHIHFPDGHVVSCNDPYLNDLLSAFIGHPVSLRHKSVDRAFFLSNQKEGGLERIRQQLGMSPNDSMKNLAIFPPTISLPLTIYVTPPGSLHDVYPVHFLTTNTLNWLSKAHPKASIDVRRFRPTFLIDGAKRLGDYPERRWQDGHLEIGSTVIKVGPPTIRCSMPAQAQPDLKMDIEVAKSIQTTAKQFVGSYGTVIESGKIVEGDEVVYHPPKIITQLQTKLARKLREPLVVALAKSEIALKENGKSKIVTAKEQLEKNGFETIKVVNIVDESASVKSFYLQAAHYYSFLPGQHLMIGLLIPNQSNPVIRAYSLSNYNPEDKIYRISVKREGKHSLASNYLHDKIKIGSELYFKRPTGHFLLHPQEKRPIALISMGIGVTPFMSMLEFAHKTNRTEKISFIYGSRNSENHIFKKEIENLQKQNKIEVYNCYSKPDKPAVIFHKKGRVDIKTIKDVVKSVDTAFYLCGTNEFMRDIYFDLLEWGVQSRDIHSEQFSKSIPFNAIVDDSKQAVYDVHFAQSNLKAKWSKASNSLLELAESCGLKVSYGCRYGLCGACEVKLKSGSITYNDSLPNYTNDNTLLLCCAIPTSDLVIEL